MTPESVQKQREKEFQEELARQLAKEKPRPRRDTRDNFPTAPKPAKPKTKAKKPKR